MDGMPALPPISFWRKSTGIRPWLGPTASAYKPVTSAARPVSPRCAPLKVEISTHLSLLFAYLELSLRESAEWEALLKLSG